MQYLPFGRNRKYHHGPPITPADAADVAPLFTDFTSANIGTPQNYALPFLYENHPDQFGYTANTMGINYLDLGVGGFLVNVSLAVTLGESNNDIVESQMRLDQGETKNYSVSYYHDELAVIDTNAPDFRSMPPSIPKPERFLLKPAHGTPVRSLSISSPRSLALDQLAAKSNRTATPIRWIRHERLVSLDVGRLPRDR